MTLDRVLRFAPLFGTREKARCFAAEQALAWLGRPAPDIPLISSTQE